MREKHCCAKAAAAAIRATPTQTENERKKQTMYIVGHVAGQMCGFQSNRCIYSFRQHFQFIDTYKKKHKIYKVQSKRSKQIRLQVLLRSIQSIAAATDQFVVLLQ